VAVAGVVVVAAIGWAGVGAVSAVGALLSPDKPVTRAKPQVKVPALATSSTADATAAAEASASALASGSTDASASALASSSASGADAIAAAAVKFPGAPAIAPQSVGPLHPAEKMVAITIDDGSAYDIRLLQLFEANDLHLTTFLTGQAVTANPKFTARLAKDGFEIANHTWDHSDLATMGTAEIRSELLRAQKAISAVTGNQAPYLRPPSGATNSTVRQTAGKLGYKVVLWTKSFADTSQAATPDRLYHNVVDTIRPGDIILCHWAGKDTYEAMKLILPELAKRGYKVVSLSELIAASNAAKAASSN
jgi:peptidoglycan/xylan/chitin deacetylase (PgdA/CDA1 family)